MRLTEFHRACCDIKPVLEPKCCYLPAWMRTKYLNRAAFIGLNGSNNDSRTRSFCGGSYTRKYLSTVLQMWVMSNWTISYKETCLPSQPSLPSAILVFPVAVDVVSRVGGDACGVTAERDGAKSATDQTAMWNTQVCNQTVTLARIS